MSTQIAPSRTLALLIWAGVATATIAAVGTIVLELAGIVVASVAMLATAYTALTVAGRWWSR